MPERTGSMGTNSRAKSWAARLLVLGLSCTFLCPKTRTQCELIEAPGGIWYGQSVSIEGSLVAIGGVNYADIRYLSDGGTTVDPADDAWVRQETLFTEEIGDSFGFSVALSGAHVVVGAPTHGVFGSG